jgi:hypothetical protein
MTVTGENWVTLDTQRGHRRRLRADEGRESGQGRLAQLRRLPWTTQIRMSQAYERNPQLYRALNLTPVPAH